MYCSKCGKEVQDGAVFCPFCGQKPSDDVPRSIAGVSDSTGDVVANSTQNASGKPKIKLIVGIVLCLAAITLVVVGMYQVLRSEHQGYIEICDQAISNRSELYGKSDSIYSGIYGELRDLYTEIIVEFQQKILVDRILAVSFSLVGVACGVAGAFLIVKSVKERKKTEEYSLPQA